MSTTQRAPGGESELLSWKTWLWNHIGRITGTLLGLIAIAAIAFLAAIGFKPALGFLIVIVVGITLIVVGGRIKGS